jgi:hypothetical protein
MLGVASDNNSAPRIHVKKGDGGYVPRMVRSGHCARPGCGEPATALLTYDYTGRTVWLDDASEIDGSSWPLCSAHADGLKVPVGWNCEDRRAQVVPLPASWAS